MFYPDQRLISFRKLILLLFIVLLPGAACLNAQDARFVSYSRESGLPRPEVTAIFHDTRGVLWIGTRGAGLYQFRHGRFVQQDILPENSGFHIRQIAEGAGGTLYFLTEKGLLTYDGRRLSTLDQSEAISAVVTTKNAVAWLRENVLIRRNTEGTQHEIDVRSYALAGAMRTGEMLAIGKTIAAFDKYGKLAWTAIVPDGFQYRGQDHDGGLWFADPYGTLLRYDGHRFERHQTQIGGIREIAGGALGSIWIAGDHGLAVYQPRDSTLLHLRQNVRINSAYFDRHDRLWLGTESMGLMRYFGERFRSWPLRVGEDATTILYGATAGSSMLVTPGGLRPPEVILPVIEPPKGCVETLYYKDAMTRIWALCDQSLWFWDAATWIRMDSTLEHAVHFSGSDRAGNVWISAPGALYHFGFSTTRFASGFTFATKYLTGFPEDDPVRVTPVTGGEFLRIGAHTITRFAGDRIVEKITLPYRVLTAHHDDRGNVWLGTSGAGIYIIPSGDDTPRSVTAPAQVRIADIVFLLRNNGQLIAGTDHSILRLHLDTIEMRITQVEALHRDAGISFSSLRPEHFAVTGDRHLLVLTSEDLIALDIAGQTSASAAPGLYLRQVLAGGDDLMEIGHTGPFYQSRNVVNLPYSMHTVTFALSGQSVEAGTLLYQWRLTGRDTIWSVLSAQQDVTFPRLPPGLYAFEARVCNSEGRCTALQAPWNFRIQKPFWMRTGFHVAIVLMFCSLVWMAYRTYRTRRRREKARLEAELNALTLERKALQLQMNPHFIFNALETIRAQIGNDRLSDARLHLTRFAKLMRSMLEMSRTELISLETELEFLESYMDTGKLIRSQPLEFEIQVEESIQPFEIMIPPMLIQPVVENAVKYGGDDNSIHVKMEIKMRENFLLVSIEDNGRGFGTHTSIHSSASLKIIRERLSHIGKGGRLEIDERRETGARVVLFIPLTVDR